MATDLRKANSSQFIQLGNKFRDKRQKQKVYVYVEDDLDIVFWKHFFRKYDTSYTFVVQTLQINQKNYEVKLHYYQKLIYQLWAKTS